jgi:hypothetical protein
MPHDEIPWQPITVAKGEAFTRYVRILGPERVRLATDAAAGATTLLIKPDHPSIGNGEKLLAGDNIIVTLTEACPAGDTSLVVSAIVGPVSAGSYLQRIVKDLSGYTVSVEIVANRGDATPVLTIAPTVTDDTEDPAAIKSDVLVISTTAAQMAFGPGHYAWFAWRTNAGSERPIANGSFTVEEKARL